MSNSDLKGIRVISFTSVWAGPWMGAVLADMGAEVIKIESGQKPDIMKFTQAGGIGETSMKTRYSTINRGVKSCSINLKQARGVEIVKELVKVSDVVITNYAPRVLPSFGLGYEELKKINLGIIMVALSGFGSTGPLKDYVAYASGIEGAAGLNASFGYSDGDPGLASLYPGDPISSMYGVFCLVSALIYRKKTGNGQYVDISESEGVSCLIPEVIMEYVMNSRNRPRMGNLDDIMAPHGCYRCKGDDKWVAIAVSSDKEWSALCNAMGQSGLANEKRFSDQFSRWQNQKEIDKIISEWTKDLTHYQVMQRLQKVGVSSGPSFNIEELIDDPHTKARKSIFEKNQSTAGKIIVYRSPWISAQTRNNPPAPCLGEHNNYVFKELLGMSDEELDQLVNEQVIY